MKTVYLVCECYPFPFGYTVLKVFKSEKDAWKFRDAKEKRQKNKPQYDDWGLVEGKEFSVMRTKVE